MASAPGPDFFDARREWSRWKHRLLERYLGEFFGRLRQGTCFYVDAFAGAGRYERTTEPGVFDDGSPIIAARLAANPKTQGRLQCINIEADPDYFGALVELTASNPKVLNLAGTFADQIDEVMSKIGSAATLFFIDPFGGKGMEWDVVARVVQRSRAHPTDVLLNLNAPDLDVKSGYLRSTDKAAPAFIAHLDRVFGTTEWRDIASSRLAQGARIEALATLYVDRLRLEFSQGQGSPGYAHRFPVMTIEKELKYFIVHGSRHGAGAVAMSHAVFKVAKDFGVAHAEHAARGGVQGAFSFAEEPPEPDSAAIVAGLKASVLKKGTKGWKVKLGELEQRLMDEWFGRASDTLFKRAVRELVKEGVARVVSGSTPTNPLGARVVIELL